VVAYHNIKAGALSAAELDRQGTPKQKGTPPPSPPNKTTGKSFTGGRGGGLYTNVADDASPSTPIEETPGSPKSPKAEVAVGTAIVLEMKDEGTFVYRYTESRDGVPDGPEILKIFLESLFENPAQKAYRGDNVVQELQDQLAEGNIHCMADLRKHSKRDLDTMGIPVGPRAALVDKNKTWTPPNWEDSSFILRGKWSAVDYGVSTKVTYTAETEEITAYDGVEVPSGAVFSLDGAFTASGQCRGLNGNVPGKLDLERAFLAFTTDMVEEEEVEKVRIQKEQIREVLGHRIKEMSETAEWMLTEYNSRTGPLLDDGGVYVSHESVKKSGDKILLLKSILDQTLATFEDYYGNGEDKPEPKEKVLSPKEKREAEEGAAWDAMVKGSGAQ